MTVWFFFNINLAKKDLTLFQDENHPSIDWYQLIVFIRFFLITATRKVQLFAR